MKHRTEIFDLSKFKNRINWEITHQCNFNCSYCCNSNASKNSVHPAIFTPIRIKDFFDKTEKEWLILITGGEPFLYPNFVEICNLLQERNYLQITTNLSHQDVLKFASKIDPSRVFNISASYHHEIRNNTSSKEKFINNCLLLKEKGFPLLVNLIALPWLINTIEDDIMLFHKNNIETILFGYRGMYENKIYPDSYTNAELELIKKYAYDETEIKIALDKMSFYGQYCDAGINYFGLKQNGDIIRCYSLPKVIGNLFKGNFPKTKRSKPCISNKCYDCYNGVAAVKNKKAGYFKIKNEIKNYKKLDFCNDKIFK